MGVYGGSELNEMFQEPEGSGNLITGWDLLIWVCDYEIRVF